MSGLAWSIINRLLHVLHVTVISLCVLGWTHPALHAIQFWVILAVAFSWFVLGLRMGMGYCLLTDLQWRVKDKLGHGDRPNSYVKYAIDRVLGTDMAPRLAKRIVVWGFALSVAACMLVQVG